MMVTCPQCQRPRHDAAPAWPECKYLRGQLQYLMETSYCRGRLSWSHEPWDKYRPACDDWQERDIWQERDDWQDLCPWYV